VVPVEGLTLEDAATQRGHSPDRQLYKGILMPMYLTTSSLRDNTVPISGDRAVGARNHISTFLHFSCMSTVSCMVT